MVKLDNNHHALIELIAAGLWELPVQLSSHELEDYSIIFQLAEEQAVLGLVAAGLEHVDDIKVPKEELLQFVGQTLQVEQRNLAMNRFIAAMTDRMENEGISTILVKGQGIAQCYERPLWRSAGDIDYLIDDNHFQKAHTYLCPLADSVGSQSLKSKERKHQEYYIGPWLVELHGTMHANLSRKMDRLIDNVQKDTFENNHVRTWDNNGIKVILPSPDNDVIFVFSHILQHLFEGGIGLRQICDWCRLLWTFREEIDKVVLYERLRAMGILSEWKVFASLAVDRLRMPVDAMPFYEKGYGDKAARILTYIMETGNFGHNKDYSYYDRHSVLMRKVITFWRQIKDSARLSKVFPLDAPYFLCHFFKDGMKKLVAK